MKLTPELIIKHRALVEATVKAHTRHSKTGKAFQVKAFDRKVDAHVKAIMKQKDFTKASEMLSRVPKQYRKEVENKIYGDPHAEKVAYEKAYKARLMAQPETSIDRAYPGGKKQRLNQMFSKRWRKMSKDYGPIK